MKLTIEETNGENTELEGIRHVSITDTERMAVTWWEWTGGGKGDYLEKHRKPRRIILEFETDE